MVIVIQSLACPVCVPMTHLWWNKSIFVFPKWKPKWYMLKVPCFLGGCLNPLAKVIAREPKAGTNDWLTKEHNWPLQSTLIEAQEQLAFINLLQINRLGLWEDEWPRMVSLRLREAWAWDVSFSTASGSLPGHLVVGVRYRTDTDISGSQNKDQHTDSKPKGCLFFCLYRLACFVYCIIVL